MITPENSSLVRTSSFFDDERLSKKPKITNHEEIVKKIYEQSLPDDRCRFISNYQVIARRFKDKEIVEIFRVRDCIGEGAFGSIFKIFMSRFHVTETVQTVFKGDLALKYVSAQNDEEQTKELKNEYHVLKRLHPSVKGLPLSPYAAIYKDTHLTGFMMELFEGDYEKRLLQINRNDQIPQLIREFEMLSEGLNYLHQKGYMHGDIKPANILCKKLPDASEKAILADLGKTTPIVSLLNDPDALDDTFSYGYLPIEEGCLFNQIPANHESKQIELEELLLTQFGELSYIESEARIESLKRDIQKLEEKVFDSADNKELQNTLQLAQKLLNEIVELEKEFEKRAKAIDTFNLGITFYMLVYSNAGSRLSLTSTESSGSTPVHFFPYEKMTVELQESADYSNIQQFPNCIVFGKGENGEKIPLQPKDDTRLAIPEPLKALIFEMISPDYHRRPLMEDVRQRLDQILALEPVFTISL